MTLATVEPGMPADKAGLKIGDQILTANGENIPALEALVQMLNPPTKDQPLELVVLRNGEKRTFTVKPVLDSGGFAAGACLSDRYRQKHSYQGSEAQFFGRATTLSFGEQKEFPS